MWQKMLLETFQQGRDVLDILVALASIIGSLATAAAFFITWSTLRELKRQTELANDPLLKLRLREWDASRLLGNGSISEKYHDPEPHEQWLRIITKNLDQQDLSGLSDRYFVVELSNVGKSEITRVSFELSLRVSMYEGHYKVLKYAIEPTEHTWDLETDCDLTGGTTIHLLITNVRYFPVYRFQIKGLRYQDVRGKRYTSFDGPTASETMTNELLEPVESTDGDDKGAAFLVDEDGHTVTY